MRWLMFAILAYVSLGIQAGLSSAAPDTVRLNFMLLIVIFITVNAPREYGLLGAFMLGMLQDLFSGSPMGLWAFTYGLVGMFVVSTQEVVYKAHPLTHVSLALAGGTMSAIVILIEARLHHTHLSAMPVLKGIIYTALLAPIVLGLLDRGKRLFGFKSTRSTSVRSRRSAV